MVVALERKLALFPLLPHGSGGDSVCFCHCLATVRIVLIITMRMRMRIPIMAVFRGSHPFRIVPSTRARKPAPLSNYAVGKHLLHLP